MPDDATQQLMDDMYAGILRKRRRLSVVDALREAQLAALARNREAYGEALLQDWATFVVAGPLDLADPPVFEL